MKRLSSYPPHPPNFRFSERNFYILWSKRKCCSNRSSGTYPLNQGHMTQLPLSVYTWFYTPLLQVLASHWSQNMYFYSASSNFIEIFLPLPLSRLRVKSLQSSIYLCLGLLIYIENPLSDLSGHAYILNIV